MTQITGYPSLERERELFTRFPAVISCDEVGRGALAGPVTVGATLLLPEDLVQGIPVGLRDSKLIAEGRRPQLAERAGQWVSASALGWADASEIDDVGIMAALGLAASRAIQGLELFGRVLGEIPVLLDGNHDYISAQLPVTAGITPVVKGDRDCAGMSAASILAKVARDDLMRSLHAQHPEYHWDRNKGYASAAHREALATFGLSPYHRASWSLGAKETLW